jgi:hypothetical protein
MVSPPYEFAVLRTGRFDVFIGGYSYQRFDREAITTARPRRICPLCDCSE